MFKKMYLLLFNRVTDALDALAAGNTARAGEILVRAQQACEELYIEGTEE
ncbi:MAG: hypothetical protein IKO83_08750 [Oscillospiraceae bacterium]|nr:hypothetical protein [Oscillospiraceae bacterium]